jgi:PAS domain S-box-containing protein
VLITDRDGRIEYVNPKFCEVTGYRPDEVIGRNPSKLKSGETGPEQYAELWRTIVDGGVWHGEFHNRRKDGSLYWEAAAISAVRDATGNITHFLAVKEDITERKRLEQEVESRNRELARAQTLAEMGRMASMIAHDLRNPLSSVKVTLQVLGKRVADDEAAVELKRISLDQVAYMEAILNDMLTYARPQAPRMDWVSADRLVEAAVGLAQRKIEEQGVRIVTRLQPGLPTFPGDSRQLRQVFSNLIVNAVQAMEDTPPTERELELGADLDLDATGTMIRFRICDRGCGIDALGADKLFEPFFTTRAKGTGLGLAIVRRILDEHGGRISLLPGNPRGACAEVLLPTVPRRQPPGTDVARVCAPAS